MRVNLAVVIAAFGTGLFLLNAFLNWLDRRGELFLDLARVQWEERTQLRERLDRELSGKDTQECMDRVRRRMRDGDSVFLAPRYNAREAYIMWRRRHRKHSRNIEHIDQRREA